MANSITNTRIFDQMERMRLEQKQDLQTAVATLAQNQGRLEKKIEDIDTGKIAKLESRQNEFALQLQKAVDNTNKTFSNWNGRAVVIGAILMAFLLGLANAISNRVLK